MIRHRLLHLTAPLAAGIILFMALFFSFASFGSTGEVANAADFEVDIGPDGQERTDVDQGATITYTYYLTNTGDQSDTYTVTVVNEAGWPAVVSSETITIASLISDTVVLTLNVDSDALAGPSITTITATSSSSIDVSDFSTNTTTINAAYGVEIVDNESSTAPPDTTVVYTHTVTNLGNISDTFDITAISDKDYTTTVPAALTLAPGISNTINISIEIPAGESAGVIDETTVTATSRGSGNATDDVIDTTTINWHSLFIPVVTSPSEWNQVGANSWPGEDQATSIDVCPGDSDLIFAGTEDALHLFDGNSWTPIIGIVPKGGVISSIVMNSTCKAVYVVVFKGSQDPVIDAHGVWKGALDNQGDWIWQELTGGVNVTLARKVALFEEKLFAAGGFGITYWDNNAWVATNVGATSSNPFMDLSIADGLNNEGPLYAVRWLDTKVYQNTNPGSNPGAWSPIAGLDDIPDNGMVRSVAGDESNVRYVGTTENLYGLTGKSWGLVNDQESRTVLISGNVYAGFAGAPGDGVYISRDQGASFSDYNEGWEKPQTVFALVHNPDYLFAATSAGVFKR